MVLEAAPGRPEVENVAPLVLAYFQLAEQLGTVMAELVQLGLGGFKVGEAHGSTSRTCT